MLGVSVVEGREFDDRDTTDGPRAADREPDARPPLLAERRGGWPRDGRRARTGLKSSAS